MNGFLDVVVVWGALSFFAGFVIVFYVNGNFDNTIGRDSRPATCRTWVAMFLEAWIPTIVAFGLVILFLLGIAYLLIVTPMFAGIPLFIGLAVCIYILWAVYWAEQEEERERQAFFGMWESKRLKDNERYCIYLRRKHERGCKKMGEKK